MTVILPQAQTLSTPHAFEQWVTEQRRLGLTFQALGQALMQERSTLAWLRAARLLSYAPTEDPGLLSEALSLCLRSPDATLAQYAKSIVVELELRSQPAAAGFALPVLEDGLVALRALPNRTALVTETECQLLNVVSLLYLETGGLREAQRAASEGLLLCLPLGLKALSINLRLNHALASFRLGAFDQAQADYQAVIQDQQAGPMARMLAQLNSSALHVIHGELQRALSQFTGIQEAHPNHPVAQIGVQYVKALRGMLNGEEKVVPCPDHNYDRLTGALQVLNEAQRTGKRALLLETSELLKHWRPASASLVPVMTWVQTVALLRQDKPFLAAQRVAAAQAVQPLFQILVQAAKLEIALHVHGVELEPTEVLTARLAQLLEALTTREAREGAAELLMLWHPLATSFLAMSPHSSPETMDLALPAVFMDGRPIQVYGQAVRSRLPFVQLTLQAFGISAEVGRDQSAEWTRMEAVTLGPWGDTVRRFPVVPPALLIYNLMRVAERAGPAWLAAAHELTRVHGMVPTTSGNHLRTQRAALHQWLDALVHRKLSAEAFKAQLSTI